MANQHNTQGGRGARDAVYQELVRAVTSALALLERVEREHESLTRRLDQLEGLLDHLAGSLRLYAEEEGIRLLRASSRRSEPPENNAPLPSLSLKMSEDGKRCFLKVGDRKTWPLQPRVAELLSILVKRRTSNAESDGRWVSLEEAGRLLGTGDEAASKSNVSTILSRLRRAFWDAGLPRDIVETKPDRGVRLMTDVKMEPVIPLGPDGHNKETLADSTGG